MASVCMNRSNRDMINYKVLLSFLGYLDTPTQIISKVNDLSSNKLCPYEVTWLGVDLLECLLWRKGALMYAYCCTVYNDAERMNNDCDRLVKVRCLAKNRALGPLAMTICVIHLGQG